MIKRIAARDKPWLLSAIICALYFATLSASGCSFRPEPLAFVRGCYNYGVNWNMFMAPIGGIVLVLMPLTFAYWLLRGLQALSSWLRVHLRHRS